MADLFVKIDELAGYAAALSTLGAEAARVQDSNVASFAQYGDSWGHDAPGAAFLAVYLGPATETLDCVRQLPVQMEALGEAMLATSRSYTGTETGNAQLSGGLAR